MQGVSLSSCFGLVSIVFIFPSLNFQASDSLAGIRHILIVSPIAGIAGPDCYEWQYTASHSLPPSDVTKSNNAYTMQWDQ